MAGATRRARRSVPDMPPRWSRSRPARCVCATPVTSRRPSHRESAPPDAVRTLRTDHGVRKFSEARVAPPRFQTSLKRRLRAIRAHPLLNPTALAEGWREWLRSYPADPTHEPHLVAAVEWLVRAQDATADCGAARYLVATLDPDGQWRSDNSRFARSDSTLYNTRTAWALAEAGARLDERRFTAAAARSLHAAADLQTENGWLPRCCLTDPEQPLLHTLAYAIRGLLEGGRVLGEPRLLHAAERAARSLTAKVRTDGWMPGRYRSDWSPAVRWSCLTGQAQMANNWMRLAEITGDATWLEPVPAVLRFLKRTQNRD